MMLHPTIQDLTKGKINRYELAVATAKCARSLNNDYIAQKEMAEKAASAGKDVEFVVTVDQELADVKPVRVAIDRIHAGEYRIIRAADAVKLAEERGKETAE